MEDRTLLKPLSLPIRILRQWAGAGTEVSNTARLRPALASLNHRILMLAVVVFSWLLPSIADGSLDRRVAALAVEGAFCLALFAVRSRLRGHIREQWEMAMQGVLRSALLPDMPAASASEPVTLPALRLAAGLETVPMAA